MGTNFYAEQDPTCNNPAHTKTLHIGKSSQGWKFAFRAYDDLGLTSWDAWRTYLTGRPIHDEYGIAFTLAEFAERVENRRPPRGEDGPWCHVATAGRYSEPGDEFHDDAGFDFSRRSFS